MQPMAGPADMPLLQHRLEKHEQVEVDRGQISLVQHLAEIISLDSSQVKCDIDRQRTDGRRPVR